MKRNKELMEMSKDELNKKMIELKKELMKYNSQISTKTPSENPGRVRNVKKNIARIKTFIKTAKQEVSKK